MQPPRQPDHWTPTSKLSMPSARLYIPEKIYHEMREKGYLKAVPIGNILEIGIAQYDQWVAEGLD
ncbi:MAG: hypothetical protein ABSD41_12460, partial [Candidatus Bathyarchaeia archaeon]